MIIHFIEATEPTGFNWGKFMIGVWTPEEWARPSHIGQRPMLLERGWRPGHILVVDIQTGEGCIFSHGGSASHDLNEKHQVWVCPMFEPFLEWLYKQDVSDITKLPAHVELPEGTETSMRGYRRRGPEEKPKTPLRCRSCAAEWPAFYHVPDALWAEAGFHPKHIHCLPCLEKALGRPTTLADFDEHELNSAIRLLLSR